MGFGTTVYGADTSTPVQATTLQTPTSTTPAQEEPRQFADEIIRRLRRLGINFSKTRLSRPYGMEGDIC